MRTIVNKTYAEIVPGNSVLAERRLQTGDLRAWDNSFGDTEMPPGTRRKPGR